MYKYIGERIRKIREIKGISQKQLGTNLGLSDKAISSYEGGRTLPPVETLFKIAKELKKPVSYFLTEIEEDSSVLERIVKIEDSIIEIMEDLRSIKEIECKSDENAGIITPPNVPS